MKIVSIATMAALALQLTACAWLRGSVPAPPVGKTSTIEPEAPGIALAQNPDWQAQAENVGDLGPKLRRFDRKKDCQCVDSFLTYSRAVRDLFGKLADTYKDELEFKDLGDGSTEPSWVVINRTSLPRLLQAADKYSKDFEKLRKAAPFVGDCFDGDYLELHTDALSNKLPSAAEQKKVKRSFPFEELFDAVILHEYYHYEEFDNVNKPGLPPKLRTAYGFAREEMGGYTRQVEHLEKLMKKCPQWRLKGAVLDEAIGPGGENHDPAGYDIVLTTLSVELKVLNSPEESTYFSRVSAEPHRRCARRIPRADARSRRCSTSAHRLLPLVAVT